MHTSGTTNKESREFMTRHNTEINMQSLSFFVLRQL